MADELAKYTKVWNPVDGWVENPTPKLSSSGETPVQPRFKRVLPEVTDIGVAIWPYTVRGGVNDPSELPATAEKGDAYVQGYECMYVFDEVQWREVRHPLAPIPHPLEFGSAPWTPSSNQLTTIPTKAIPEMQDQNQPQEAAVAEPTYGRGQRPEFQHLDDSGHTSEQVGYTAADVGRIVFKETYDDVTFVTEIVGVNAELKYADFSRNAIVKMTKLDTAAGDGAVEGEYINGSIFTDDRKTVRLATELERQLATEAITAAAAKRGTSPQYSLADGTVSDGPKLPEGVDLRKYWEVNSVPASEEAKPTSPVKTINGVDVIPLGEVTTVDGVQPFKDGKIVGVFEGDDKKTLVERLGDPVDYISKTLADGNDIAEPKAWERGLNRAIYDTMTLEQRIFMVNQHLRLRFTEYTEFSMPDRLQHRMQIADVKPDDWYRVAAALILPAMIKMEPKILAKGYDAGQ